MFRRFSTGLAAAVLVGASLQAPLAHVHPGDPDHHHASGFAHAHFEFDEHHGHQAEGPEIEVDVDHHERAIYLEWTPSAEARVSVEHLDLPLEIAVEFSPVRAGSAPEFRPRAHSPPLTRLLPARAPPV